MEYKNQHWIPQSYLKAWCDPTHKDRIVHIYDAEGTHRGWRPYTRIFSCDDLYTVERGGERDVYAEKAFKLIEDRFLKARRLVEGNDGWHRDTKTILAWYVAATRNRSPAARDHWQSFKNRVVEVADSMAEGLAVATPSQREAMARASRWRQSDPSNSMTHQEARESAAEPFGRWVLRHIKIEADLLDKMSFAILQAPDGAAFITSDNPVVWHDAAPDGRRRAHIGLGYKHVEVTMPLSPSHCVMFDHFGKDGLCEVGQATVDMINDRTLNHCRSCFVAQSGELTVDWVSTGDGEASPASVQP